MRLQVRVTPAHQELLEHLETIDKEYRGKRLIALAAMQLRELQTGSNQTRQPSLEQTATAEPESNSRPSVQQRVAPKWLKGHDDEKE